MKKILLASGNPDKVREAQAILGIPIEIAPMELEEIQSMDLALVVRKKAEEAYKILQKPVIVDDVSVEFGALNGFPATFIKFFLESLGNRKILSLLKNETNKKMIARAAVGYHDGKKVHVFIGEVEGTFSPEERGEDGWGFDFFFIPKGQTQTFAQMGFEKKNELSHRRVAFELLKQYLDSQKT